MSDEIGPRLLDKLMYIIAMLKEHGGSGEAIEWCETASEAKRRALIDDEIRAMGIKLG